MKHISTWALAATNALYASAIELAPRSANPRVVGLDVQRKSIPDIISYERSRLAKRQNTVSETLANDQSLYFANITLGTPSQSLRMQIDTGSSDLWVNVANSSFCSSNQNPCIGGTYDPSSSSSMKIVNSDFNITYADGSGATGDYVTDTLGFAGLTLDNFQFGIGDTSSSEQGVLGIGYATNEAVVQYGLNLEYPNLPVALVNAGKINRNAYSLWLNDLDANSGTLLFGGVDKTKFKGTLETVPIYRTDGTLFSQFIVALSGISLNGSSISSGNLPSPVILDSGSTISRLPNDIVSVLYNKIGVEYDSGSGVGLAPCKLQNLNAYIGFTFSGVNIQVPFNELFLEAGTNVHGQPLTFQNGEAACLFGIAPAEGIIPILGDTFLRSAYVVYDLANNEISLAQTVFNATGSDIVEIASGTSAIPDSTPAPSTVTSLALGTATDGAVIGLSTGTFTGLGANPTGTFGNSASSINLKVSLVVVAAMMAGAALLM